MAGQRSHLPLWRGIKGEVSKSDKENNKFPYSPLGARGKNKKNANHRFHSPSPPLGRTPLRHPVPAGHRSRTSHRQQSLLSETLLHRKRRQNKTHKTIQQNTGRTAAT